jgi:DNA processing protein
MIEHSIWFSMISLSYTKKLQLLIEYETPENLWNNLLRGSILDCSFASTLKSSWDDKKILEIKQRLISNDIKIAAYNDSLYPSKLRNYDDAPSILFYKGDIESINKGLSVSIVGSRNCTSYGLNTANIISAELSKMGVKIVSGMAKGIDTHAHTSCMENKGFTCAVLGSGLDVIYPKENKKLFHSIAEAGCVISEFLPGTEPFAYNFPIRNRIISELSDIVIIVEAGIKSGSLITATFALEKGIDVMAVPGSIFSLHSKGCNKLIKDGAYPLTCIEDVFQLLNIDVDNRKKKIKSNILSDMESRLYHTLSDNPLHINDIIKLTNIDINNLYEVLFELQLRDEILCLAGNYYVRNMKNI